MRYCIETLKGVFNVAHRNAVGKYYDKSLFPAGELQLSSTFI
jgi:hypothetical protein